MVHAIAIFWALYLGPWSDQGRKPTLLLPFIGHLISGVVPVLVVYFEVKRNCRIIHWATMRCSTNTHQILRFYKDHQFFSAKVVATHCALRRQHLQLLRGLHPPRHRHERIRGGRHHRQVGDRRREIPEERNEAVMNLLSREETLKSHIDNELPLFIRGRGPP